VVPQPLDPALVAQLQALLDDTVTTGSSPGAVLSVSIPGYVPWSGASGIADRRDARLMEPDTLIHTSSITKMFTAVMVLQLAQEGVIDLDAPISTWLPDIVPLADRTTVRHLLNHTSGIFDYLEDSEFFIEAYQNPERTYTPSELVDMVDQYGAAFEPGSEGAWKYSSTNYVILGILVEQVTGRTFAEEMRQRIVEPLQLTHTFFAPYEAVEGSVAQGYIDTSDRADVSMTFVFATGNIISTANDLRRFVDGLFSGHLLHAESVALMATTMYTGGAYDMPELEYGLGLMRARLAVGPGPDGAQRPDELSTVLGHIGGIAGSRAAVWRVSERGITIALGLNQANIDPNVLARDTLEVILLWQGQ
jgi:D-alanyl-D-alanine carboxypeptidase